MSSSQAVVDEPGRRIMAQEASDDDGDDGTRCSSSDNDYSCNSNSPTRGFIEENPFAALEAFLAPAAQDSGEDDNAETNERFDYAGHDTHTNKLPQADAAMDLNGNIGAFVADESVSIDASILDAPTLMSRQKVSVSNSLAPHARQAQSATNDEASCTSIFSRHAALGCRDLSSCRLLAKPSSDPNPPDDDRHRALWKESRRLAMLKESNSNVTLETAKKPPTRIGVVRSKYSIVGTRPKHWGTQNNSKAGAFSFSRKLKSHVTVELSEMTPKVRAKALEASTQDTKASKVVTSPTKAPASITPASITFMPPFLCTPALAKEPSIDESNTGETVDAAAGGIVVGNLAFTSQQRSPPPTFASPPTKRRKVGTLTNRLRAVRSGILGDMIRFQSGQYPFQKKMSAFDMNDPRGRAKSYMDITLLRDATKFGSEPSNNQMLKALAYVHQHVVQGSCSAQALTHRLVWVIFGKDADRSHGLRATLALRIYNAVTVELQSPLEWTVVCTDLCERYPVDVLGKLPAIPLLS